jgi:hypothetical protein
MVMINLRSTEPTPASIKLTPYVSVFASLLGKFWKSTARMARHVASIIMPRYDDMNGLCWRFRAVAASWRAASQESEDRAQASECMLLCPVSMLAYA